MDKKIKIMLIVALVLAVIAGAFLFFSKKKTPALTVAPTSQIPESTRQMTPAQQEAAASPKKLPVPQTSPAPTTSPTPTVTKKIEAAPSVAQIDAQKRKALIRSQWKKCKDGTAAATNFFWEIKIAEGIPVGGTYAKGNLDGDLAFPLQVVIKSDSTNIEKIKSSLVVGKTSFLRGTCAGASADGAVIFQAF